MMHSTLSQSIADQPWLRDFLSELGFQRTAPDTFSNGRSSVRVEGTVLYAIPAGGGKAWRTEIPKVCPESVCQLLKIMLASPKFLSQAELDQRSARQCRAEEALQILARIIRENPDSQSGVQLRRFVWSLYNGHHVLNLWRMKDALDGRNNAALTEVFSAWMQGFVSEDALRRTLTESGEMDRWDKVRLGKLYEPRLVAAVDAVTDLLKVVSPSPASTQLMRVSELLHRVLEDARPSGSDDSPAEGNGWQPPTQPGEIPGETVQQSTWSQRTVSVIGSNREILPDEEVRLELSGTAGPPVKLWRGTRSYRPTGREGTRLESGLRLFEMADPQDKERLWLNERLTTIFEE